MVTKRLDDHDQRFEKLDKNISELKLDLQKGFHEIDSKLQKGLNEIDSKFQKSVHDMQSKFQSILSQWLFRAATLVSLITFTFLTL
jgi:hypothetical protein